MSIYYFDEDFIPYYSVESPINTVSVGVDIIKMSSPITFYILLFLIVVGIATIICYIIKKIKKNKKLNNINTDSYNKVKNKIKEIIDEKINQKIIEDKLKSTEDTLIQ